MDVVWGAEHSVIARVTEIRSRLALASAMLLTTIAVGTAGYAALEGWPWFDAFWYRMKNIDVRDAGQASCCSR